MVHFDHGIKLGPEENVEALVHQVIMGVTMAVQHEIPEPPQNSHNTRHRLSAEKDSLAGLGMVYYEWGKA